ncbi:N-acetylgalactosamine-N,N'-diacetylbacillosaminyl-diphospho-undecaprenol 4-alpha-N-acetylgalactosaminyltransferase [Serratia plymuthica]|nr:N-acetylgalactosamine-N,N'-diacetylbacillosaminyl-diphospho-undecaprenol 4-alpha-N-acetylgalactosaminyltransferase [Serratia plymuthica]
MKNILFVMPILGLTGADRVIFTLLNNLDRARFRPMLLLYKNDPNLNVLVKELRPDVDVTYLNISGRARFSFPKILTGIRRVCKEKKVNTLFISSGTSNAVISPFLFLFGKRVKTIARESNLPSLFEKSTIVKFLYNRSYKNYDYIVAQSDDMRADLINNFNIPADKIVKINNPLDYRYITALSQRDGEVCFDRSKINLLSIGRLTHQKGFDLLLNEFAKVKDERYHLTIIGEGRISSRCSRYAVNWGWRHGLLSSPVQTIRTVSCVRLMFLFQVLVGKAIRTWLSNPCCAVLPFWQTITRAALTKLSTTRMGEFAI